MLVGVSMVKNESDLIERWIRINAKVLDAFVIYDDKSADDTGHIINMLKHEGYRIELASVNSQFERLEYQQKTVTNRALKHAQDMFPSASHFFLLDADEFLFDSRKVVVQCLDSVTHGYPILEWITAVPNGDTKATKSLRSQFSLWRSDKPQYKTVVPRRHVDEADIDIGNHRLRNRQLRAVPCGLFLYHFPVRSKLQILAKTFVISAKFVMKRNRSVTEGHHIRSIVKKLRSNKWTVSDQDLSDFAKSYLNGNCFHAVWPSIDEPQMLMTSNEYQLVAILAGFVMELIQAAKTAS